MRGLPLPLLYIYEFCPSVYANKWLDICISFKWLCIQRSMFIHIFECWLIKQWLFSVSCGIFQGGSGFCPLHMICSQPLHGVPSVLYAWNLVLSCLLHCHYLVYFSLTSFLALWCESFWSSMTSPFLSLFDCVCVWLLVSLICGVWIKIFGLLSLSLSSTWTLQLVLEKQC